VTVQCTCGKRLGLSDALIGKTIKCPKCREEIFVSPSAQTLPKAPAKKARETIHISGGLMALAAIVILLAGGTLTLKLGPMRVWNQWEGMNAKAAGDITDVVSFALQAYMSQIHLYNPTKSHRQPAVDGPISFKPPFLVMSMPEKVPFAGMSNQGQFVGFYHPATGEIEADIAYGGREVAGLIVTQRAAGVFHITGRDANGSPQAEVDGTSLAIYYPPPTPDEP